MTPKKNDPQFYENLDYPVLGPGFSQVPGTVLDLKILLFLIFFGIFQIFDFSPHLNKVKKETREANIKPYFVLLFHRGCVTFSNF